MSKTKEVKEAVFFKQGKRPKCPDCLYSLKETIITDYGATEDYLFFVSPCEECGQQARYYTDSEDKVVKTTIVERNE